ALIVLWPKRWGRYAPAPVVALLLGTAAVLIFHLHVETIGSRFGGIPRGLPVFHAPHANWLLIEKLIRPAITIALLAAIESLLSAVVADGMINDRHDSNQELMAQGIANMVAPFFGGIPATGAVELGMLLAALLFIKRISDNTAITLVTEGTETEGDQHSLRGKDVPAEVLVFQVSGAFLFGAAEKLEEFIRDVDNRPKVVIL